MFTDACLDGIGQAAGTMGFSKVFVGIKQWKCPFINGDIHRGVVGRVTHGFRNAGRHAAPFRAVVFEFHHDQGIAQTSETQANTAFVLCFALLLFQRPDR